MIMCSECFRVHCKIRFECIICVLRRHFEQNISDHIEYDRIHQKQCVFHDILWKSMYKKHFLKVFTNAVRKNENNCKEIFPNKRVP